MRITTTDTKDGPGILRRLGALALIAMLVVSPIGSMVLGAAAPVQTASAATGSDASQCVSSGEPSMVQTVLYAGIPAYVDAAQDLAGMWSDQCYTTTGEAANKSQADLYAMDLGVADQADAYLVANDNWREEMRTTAMGRARMAVAESINNGSTKSQVVYQAKKAVHEYYAGRQKNLIKAYERHARSLYYSTRSAYTSDITTLHLIGGATEGADTPDTTDNLSPDELRQYVWFGAHGAENWGYQSSEDSMKGYDQDGAMRNITVTLADNSTMKVPVLGMPEGQNPSSGDAGWQTEYRSTALIFAPTTYNAHNISDAWTDANGTKIDSSTHTGTVGLMRVVSQSPTGETTTVFRAERYRTAWIAISNQHDQMVSNAAAFAREAYAAYQSGDISLSQIAGPTTIAARAASSYQSTGYYAYASTSLAAAGVSTSLNTSMTYTVTHEEQPDPWMDPQVHNAPTPATTNGGNVTVSAPFPYGGTVDFDGNSAGKIRVPVTENGVDVTGVTVVFKNSTGAQITTATASSPDTTDTTGTDTYTLDLSTVSGIGSTAGHTSINIDVQVTAAATTTTVFNAGALTYTPTTKTTRKNVTGQVMVSQDAFTLSVNQTYVAGNISGSEWVVYQQQNGSRIVGLRADDTVTIHSMTSITTGQSINQTTTEKRVYKTMNGSKLQQQLDQLETLLKQYEKQQTAGPTGGGSLFGGFGSIGGVGALAILALLAVIALLVLD